MVEIDYNSSIPIDPTFGFESFFKYFEPVNGKFKYLEKIQEMQIRFKLSLDVDFKDLMLYDPKLAVKLHENAFKYINYANQALVNILCFKTNSGVKLTDEFYVRFHNLPQEMKLNLRYIRSSHIGKLHSISGSLLRMTDVKPKITIANFHCKLCGAQHNIAQIDDELIYPNICSVGGCKNSKKTGFRVNSENSKYIDWQRIRIQEKPEDLEGGTSPRFLDCLLKNDIVDRCKPGNRINVVGYIHVQPIRNSQGGQQVIFKKEFHINSINSEDNDEESLVISIEDKKQIIKFSKKKNIHDLITKSIAPEISGHYEIKKAASLVLFEGIAKIKKKTGHKIRGSIHVLIMGDPGCGKSQIIKNTTRLAPKSRYTSGKGSSAAGLCAAVLRDEISGLLVLEAGALVLASSGICGIDEFDKMRNTDRDALHEVMSQQTVSINKAGIQATLNSKTSIIAAANPKRGRWDPDRSITENINLIPSILSRFDLIFNVRDIPNKKKDSIIIKHILEVNCTDDDNNTKKINPILDSGFLKKYIKYSRDIKPKISKKIQGMIHDFYIEMRSKYDSKKAIPIDPRSGEGIIRLCEAHAKQALRKRVTIADFEAITKLILFSMKQTCWDEENQTFDVDMIQLGRPQSKIEKLKQILKIIKDIEDYAEDKTVPIDNIIEAAQFSKIKETEVRQLLELLKDNSEIIETKTGRYKLTEY